MLAGTVWVTGRCSFFSSVNIGRRDFGRYDVSLPFHIDPVSETYGVGLLKNISISDVSIDEQLMLHLTDRIEIIISQVIAENMTPFLAEIDILFGGYNQQFKERSAIAITRLLRKAQAEVPFPARFEHHGGRLPIVGISVAKNGVSYASGVERFQPAQMYTHHMYVGSAYSNRGIGASFGSIGGLASFDESFVRNFRLLIDGDPLLPSEETIDDTNNQQSFLNAQRGEPRFIFGACLFCGGFFLMGYGVKRSDECRIQGRLIVLISAIGMYSGGSLMFFGIWY